MSGVKKTNKNSISSQWYTWVVKKKKQCTYSFKQKRGGNTIRHKLISEKDVSMCESVNHARDGGLVNQDYGWVDYSSLVHTKTFASFMFQFH